MLPHQERVVLEKKELDEKIQKLGKFIESGDYDFLDREEKSRLLEQHGVMGRYSDILALRIEAFKKDD